MAKRPTRSVSKRQRTTENALADAQAASALEQAPDMGGPMMASASMASEPPEEEIRMRAYRRYLERGGSDGQEVDDWLAAERELKQPR